MKFIILYLLLLFPLSKPTKSEKWEILFDGKSTDKFRGYKIQSFPSHCWEVKDGALRAKPDPNNIDLITKGKYKNFELVFDWKVSREGNSGVFYHILEDSKQESGNGNSPNWMKNFEMQILDDENFYDKNPKRSAGALYDLIAPTNKKLKHLGEYNTAKLVVNGKNAEHWLNGVKVVSYEFGSKSMNELLKDSKFKEVNDFARADSGHIMFQHHGQEVWFKNIKVRRMD